MDRIFFHIDVNSAFLSWSAVEKLKTEPTLDLRAIPAIIGGDSKTRHGIVLAKSIPAKKLAIDTAEPIASALKKCPTLVIEPPNMELYRHNSNQLMEYLSSYCPDIEQVSIDECYMDYTPIARNYASPLEAAEQIKNGVYQNFGFTVNIGISDRKVLAKMASDFEKPDRIHTLFSYEIQSKMWPLPVSNLFMCGHSSVQALRNLGIITIGDLAQCDQAILASNLKSHGQMLYAYANGCDDSVVVTQKERLKGVGNSTTLSKDLTTIDEVRPVLLQLAGKVSRRLRFDSRFASMVSVEIKYSNFQSNSHQTTLIQPTSSEQMLYQTACILFEEIWNGTPVRLLGIRTSKLVDEDAPSQMSIFDFVPESFGESGSQPDWQKQRKAEKAIDDIRQKYGDSAIIKGRFLPHQKE